MGSIIVNLSPNGVQVVSYDTLSWVIVRFKRLYLLDPTLPTSKFGIIFPTLSHNQVDKRPYWNGVYHRVYSMQIKIFFSLLVEINTQISVVWFLNIF